MPFLKRPSTSIAMPTPRPFAWKTSVSAQQVLPVEAISARRREGWRSFIANRETKPFVAATSTIAHAGAPGHAKTTRGQLSQRQLRAQHSSRSRVQYRGPSSPTRPDTNHFRSTWRTNASVCASSQGRSTHIEIGPPQRIGCGVGFPNLRSGRLVYLWVRRIPIFVARNRTRCASSLR